MRRVKAANRTGNTGTGAAGPKPRTETRPKRAEPDQAESSCIARHWRHPILGLLGCLLAYESVSAWVPVYLQLFLSMSVSPTINLSMFLPVDLSVYLSVYVCLSVCLHVYLFVCLSACVRVCLSLYHSVF